MSDADDFWQGVLGLALLLVLGPLAFGAVCCAGSIAWRTFPYWLIPMTLTCLYMLWQYKRLGDACARGGFRSSAHTSGRGRS